MISKINVDGEFKVRRVISVRLWLKELVFDQTMGAGLCLRKNRVRDVRPKGNLCSKAVGSHRYEN